MPEDEASSSANLFDYLEVSVGQVGMTRGTSVQPNMALAGTVWVRVVSVPETHKERVETKRVKHVGFCS